MFNDHGQFATKRYFVPSKKPRGWYHGDNPLDKIQWSYLLRSDDGAYWKLSSAVSGFSTEQDAIIAAKKYLGLS
jgi:hypothetical protein